MKQWFVSFYWILTAWVFARGDFRMGEPVLLTGTDLAVLEGAPIDALRLFTFGGGMWLEIPFQIDERTPDGSYFDPDDGLWDANDELVFQPQDGGALAPLHQWLDDPSSWGAPRLAIAVTDPVAGQSRWVYLYRAAGLPPPATPTYVDYDPGGDTIASSDYEIGFHPAQGIWNRLQLDQNGGLSPNLVDREKYRVQGAIPPLGIPFLIDEDDIAPTAILARWGDIRVIRRLEGEITLLTLTLPFVIERHYYQRFIGFPNQAAVDIPAGSGVEEVRFSVDLTPAASGSQLSDPNNPQLLVDGIPDGNVQTVIEPDQQAHYWFRLVYMDAVVVNVGAFAGVAAQTQLYYHDDAGGGTADGTGDTGDGVSFGDTGLRLTMPQPGQHRLGFRSYVDLSGTLSGALARQYFDQPFTVSLVEESFADSLGFWLQRWGSGLPDAPTVLFFAQFFNQNPM